MLEYLHHVNYVVENLDDTIAYLEKNFGMKPSRVEISKGNHPAREAIYFAGITEIQIVQPLDTTSGAARHLAEHGPGVTHVAWGVKGSETLFDHLLAQGNVSRRPQVSVAPRGYKTINIEPSPASNGLAFQLIEEPEHLVSQKRDGFGNLIEE
jgi:4-hydroxyphenylpyruvate dioxygenase-like putative hemolysin